MIKKIQKKKVVKPKVGFYSFTSCSGCQLEILDLEDVILDIANLVDIQHFPMAQQINKKFPVDIAFIEGGITNQDQIHEITEIRKNAKYVNESCSLRDTAFFISLKLGLIIWVDYFTLYLVSLK